VPSYAGSGLETLSATFAGTSQYNGSKNSKGFTVLAPTPVPSPPATPTPTPIVGTTDFSATFTKLDGKTGDQVSTAFSATNNTGAPEMISSVPVALSKPHLLSELTLSADGQTVEPSSGVSESNVLTFSPALSVAAGATVSFTATGTIAEHSAMSGASISAAYASAVPIPPADDRGLPPLIVG
jgi:plastocyanin